MEIVGSVRRAKLCSDTLSFTIEMTESELRDLKIGLKMCMANNSAAQKLSKALRTYGCEHDTVRWHDGTSSGLTEKEQKWSPKCNDCGETVYIYMRKEPNHG